MKKFFVLLLSILLFACHANSTNQTLAKQALDQGIALYEQHSYKQAKPFFQQAVQLGHIKAPRYLALMALNGFGEEKDPILAARYFQQAAEQGDITSQYWLGYLYEQGIGVKQDYALALYWYEKSAQRGDHISAPAMNALGRLYANGIGVKKDLALAKYWYQKSALTGNEEGKQALLQLH